MLYFVPINNKGEPGTFQEVQLSGPAADVSGEFNLNGIASANGGRTLIVAHSGNGLLYTVDPETGASADIDSVSVPSVDGIVLSGGGCGRCRIPIRSPASSSTRRGTTR